MSKEVFQYLNIDYRYLNNYIYAIKKLLFKNPHAAIVKEINFVTNLTLEIAKIEDKYDKTLIGMSQEERVKKLCTDGILTDDIARIFETVRIIEHNAANSSKEEELETALRIYKNIYKITYWFVKTYVDSDCEAEKYTSPMPLDEKTHGIKKESILEIIKKTEEDESNIYDEFKSNEEEKAKEKLEKIRRNNEDENYMDLAIESIFNID